MTQTTSLGPPEWYIVLGGEIVGDEVLIRFVTWRDQSYRLRLPFNRAGGASDVLRFYVLASVTGAMPRLERKDDETGAYTEIPATLGLEHVSEWCAWADHNIPTD